jgi:protoporphyrinogen/coproporphyrinogen III oxidase
MSVTRSVLVVGGGVAGLVAARALAEAQHDVLLVEASAYLGGAVRSTKLSGIDIDTGAEAFAVTRTETQRLIDELGFTPEVVAPRRSDARLLLSDGMYEMPHAMLGVPTNLSAMSVVKILGESAAAFAQELDSRTPSDLSAETTLGALVRDRMGEQVVDRILTPVVAGVHAAHPDLVECEAVIPGLVRAVMETGSLALAAEKLRSASGVPGAAIAGLRGGMTTLIKALEDDALSLGVNVEISAHVHEVSRTPDGWSAIVGNRTVFADDLVLAIDAPTAARMLVSEPEVRNALARIAVGDVAVVAMVLNAPQLDDDPVGSGLLVAPHHPTVTAKALTHVTAKWDWTRSAFGPARHLVRLSYGRDGVVEERFDDLPSIARADVSAIFGLDTPDVIDLTVTRWDRSLVFPRSGHRAAVEDVHTAVADTPRLAVIGAGLGGNGLAGTIALARSVSEQLER